MFVPGFLRLPFGVPLLSLLKKIDLRPLPLRSVLIIDRAGSEPIVNALELAGISSVVIPIRGEALLLPPRVALRLAAQIIWRVFARISAKLGGRSERADRSFLGSYIEGLKPTTVITFIDNLYSFYELARQFPGITFIAVQNGYRLAERISALPQPPSPAWLLVMSEHDRRLHLDKGFSPERTVTVGSLRQSLSQRQSRRADLPKVDICVVSQWRIGMFAEPMPFPRFSAAQDCFHGFAARYARERGVSLVIAGTTHPELENAYLHRFYSKDTPIYRRADGVDVYQAMQSARLVLTVNSTAAREAMGSGQRSLSCDYPSEEQAFHGAPERFMPLFQIEPTYEAFCSRVDAMLSMTDEEWSKLAMETADFTYPVGRPDACDRLVEIVRQSAQPANVA